MRTYLEARQRDDIKKDLAQRLMPSDGPFSPGDLVYYWQTDPSKLKHGKAYGKWVRGTVTSQKGAICILDTGTSLIRVNQSKLRKDHDDWHDVPIPLDEEVDEEQASLANSFWLAENGKLDFQELFSGSARSSSACADEGLKTGSPIDLRTGFDLITQEGQKKAWKQIIEQEPECILMAPFCRPRCKWSSMVPEHKRYAQRKAALPMVEFCVKVALYQISKGRYFILETPEGSQLWNLACILRLAQELNVTWDLLNMCAFGLKDPESGLYFHKGMYLMHNFPSGVLTPLFRKCKKDHQHQVIEGSVKGQSRASISEVYPYRFCRLLARLLNKFFYGHSHTRTSSLILDVLYSASLTDAEQNALSYFGQSRVSEPLPGTYFV